MTVAYSNGEPSGLASMLGTLIEQNLSRDPPRRRLLRPAVYAMSALDAGVDVTVRVEPGRVTVTEGADPSAHVAVATDAERLLALAAAPLRFGLPDPLSAEGWRVLRDLLVRRLRVRGLLRHPRRLARLALLLSAR